MGHVPVAVRVELVEHRVQCLGIHLTVDQYAAHGVPEALRQRRAVPLRIPRPRLRHLTGSVRCKKLIRVAVGL